MMWMWMSTIVILLGRRLNAEIEHQTAKDTTDGGKSRLVPEMPLWRTRLVLQSLSS